MANRNSRRKSMRFHKFVGSAILTIALAAPATIVAAPHPQDEKTHDQQAAENQKRVYDSEHKDYHNWDDNEEHQWKQYQSTEHLKYRDYSKANKKQQSDYWNWRHQQGDNDDHDRK
jgi:hypothetical protein